MRALAFLFLVVGCRTTPLDLGSDGGPLPDLAPPSCGGPSGLTCPTGSFCDTPPGGCYLYAVGRCQPAPAICHDIFSPVCGCDGVQYGNDCQRQKAGVAFGYEGECERPFDSAFDEGPIDLARPNPVDLSQPVDLGANDLSPACGNLTCGAGQYCFHGCCGTPGCTPPAPVCLDLPGGCTGCNCLTGGGCSCVEDAGGNITYSCFNCP